MPDPEQRRFHKPAPLSSSALDSFSRAELDPAVISQIAHETAAALVRAGRAQADAEVTNRLVELVGELGLDTIAELWSTQPARSLPGALWRLYALKEWIRRDPDAASRQYRDGLEFADVDSVVAGVGSPPGPDEVRAVVDAILRGVFEGDVSIALHRASAFCRVVAAGRAARAPESSDAALGAEQARLAAAMLTTGEDLEGCARLWRRGDLV